MSWIKIGTIWRGGQFCLCCDVFWDVLIHHLINFCSNNSQKLWSQFKILSQCRIAFNRWSTLVHSTVVTRSKIGLFILFTIHCLGWTRGVGRKDPRIEREATLCCGQIACKYPLQNLSDHQISALSIMDGTVVVDTKKPRNSDSGSKAKKDIYISFLDSFQKIKKKQRMIWRKWTFTWLSFSGRFSTLSKKAKNDKLKESSVESYFAKEWKLFNTWGKCKD